MLQNVRALRKKKWKYIEKTQNLYLEIFYFYYIFPLYFKFTVTEENIHEIFKKYSQMYLHKY